MAKQTMIHTMRHARTEFNDQRRYAGSIDVELSKSGVADARSAAPNISRLGLDVVVTSPLKRAHQTARLLVDGTIPIVRNNLCRERNFGIMEGLTWDEIQKLNPPIILIRVGNDLHTVNPKGGEPFEEVWERALKFRRHLFQSYAGQRLLVISHGVFLQMFHGVLRGLNCIESLATYPSNLELLTFRFRGERLLEERRAQLGGPEALHW